MNILMISALDLWSMGGKGGSPSLYQTLKGYDERGHRVFFLTYEKDPLDPYYQREGQASFSHVEICRFKLPLGRFGSTMRMSEANAIRLNRFRRTLLFPLLAAIEGRRILTREKIDLLYGYEVNGIPAVWILKRFYRLPSVSRFQGTILYPLLGKPRQLWRRFEHVAAVKTRADLYIMADDGTHGDRVLQALNPAAQGRTRFWRNGLDKASFQPRSSSEVRRSFGIGGSLLLLAVSRLHVWKRVDRIIEALPSILAQRQDAMLVILGDGPERQDLERLATELGVADCIRFEGTVSHDRVTDYLNASDIFVSLYDLSNLGNPLLEAMACGKCIVTLDDGSTQGLLEDGKSALLLAPERLDKLPAVIVSLADDPDLRRRLGQSAKASADEHLWTWEKRMQAEVEEVQKLILP
jgi:glycosyltransferase involved in cell wall biosynthesis